MHYSVPSGPDAYSQVFLRLKHGAKLQSARYVLTGVLMTKVWAKLQSASVSVDALVLLAGVVFIYLCLLCGQEAVTQYRHE